MGTSARPNSSTPIEEDTLPGSATEPGSERSTEAPASRTTRSTSYYIGKAILYPAYLFLAVIWLMSLLNPEDAAMALLMSIGLSVIFSPALVLGHVLVAKGTRLPAHENAA
ncbi:MAG: hypothetical protein QM776_18930 [Rhodocyclaceae bacterium]